MPMLKARDHWDLELIPQSDRVHIDSIIFVGASTMEDKRSDRFGESDYGDNSGSTYGPIVDLFAPGHDIISATHSPHNNHSWEKASGTSFAAPHVTGIIACLLSDARYRGLSPQDMKAKIIEMAWNVVEEPVSLLNRVKQTLARELGALLETFGKDDEGEIETPLENEDLKGAQERLAALLKEEGSLRVSEDYMTSLLTEEPELELLKEVAVKDSRDRRARINTDVLRLKTKIYNTLTDSVDDIPNANRPAFETTKLLASCRLDKWRDLD